MSIIQRITSALSVQQIKKILLETARRFPLAMVMSLIGTVCAVSLIQGDLKSDLLARIVWTLVLGLPLIIGIELAIEKYHVKLGIALLLHLAAVLFLIVYFLLLPQELNALEETYIIRALLWAGSFLLLMTFIPLLHRSGTNEEFWQHNMGLLSALLFTAALCVILIIGIFIGLGTIQALFQTDFDYHIYPQVWTIVVGIVGSTFFLSRVPGGTHIPQHDYAKEFRTLGQYILVPLVIAYFIILYSYSGSVLLDGDWPASIVTYMIIGFSVLGMLTAVILYPQTKERRWVQWFVRGLYIAIIPQVTVLFWAIWFPLSRYSFTEKRYMVVVFGVWLTAVALYMLFTKKKDLRSLPLSLAVLMIAVSFGPWGALDLSQQSQLQRLEEVATRSGMFNNGKLQPAAVTVLPEDSREISNIISYLANTHGKKALEPLFEPGALDSISEEYPYAIAQRIVTDILKLNYEQSVYMPAGQTNRVGYYSQLQENVTEVTTITGYDYTFTLSEPYYGFYGNTSAQPPLMLNGVSYNVDIDLLTQTITLTPSVGSTIVLPFTATINALYEEYGTIERDIPTKKMIATIETDIAKAELHFQNIFGKVKNDKLELDTVGIIMYLHIK